MTERGTGFTDEEARAAWDGAADVWEEFTETGLDYYRTEVHGPGLLRACGDVRGREALDLGCGQGYFSRELARGGARVTGIDLSPEMIRHAEAYEAREPLGIRYRVVSAADAAREWNPGSFDLVTGCMSVQDMADVPAALAAARALLRPGGRMVFSVPHPVSDMPVREWERDASGAKVVLKVDRYFDTGPAVTRWTMARLPRHFTTPFQRFTLGEWSGMIAEAGFLVARLSEPRPTPEQVARRPELEDCSRMPYFLVFDLVTGPQARGSTDGS